MKSLLRLGILALIVAMVFSPSLSATTTKAQGSMPCYGLADADCKMLTDAFTSDNMTKLTSFVMNYDLAIAVKGSPQGDVNVKVNGTGPFAIDPKAISNPDPSNTAAALNSLTMSNVIKTSVSGAAAGGDQADSIEFRIVGGKLYFMDDKGSKGKWYFVVLNDALKMAQSQTAAMGASSSTGGLPPAASAALQDPDVLAAVSAIPNIPGFIKAAATDGPDLDGVKTRKLTYNFDLVALLNAKEIRPAIIAMSKQNGGAGVTDAMLNQYLTIASTALKNSTFSVSFIIGADKLFHGVGLNIALNLDATTMAMLNSGSGASAAAPTALTANIDFLLTLSKVGQPVKVDPVADAVAMPMGGAAPSAPMAPTAAK